MKKRILILTVLIFASYFMFTFKQGSYEKEALKTREDAQSLQRAQVALDRMWQLHDMLGLTKEELLDIARYIEVKRHSMSAWDHNYLRKEKTHLARTIEYDPETKRFFIHLKKHGIRHLGSGQHKSVTRSIMYDDQRPELVANCVFLDKAQREIEITKKLCGKKGIIDTYAVGRHKKKNGDNVVSLIQKLCNSGSFLHCQKKFKGLSTEEKISICRDILQGVEAMHALDLVHRDLHGKNILLHKDIDAKSGIRTISANLIDFGQTTSPEVAARAAPKVQIPRKYNPPEAFLCEPEEIDAKKVDLYAVGLNLYFFYFKKPPEWAVKEGFLRISQMNKEEKEAFGKRLTLQIQDTIKKREQQIESRACKELQEVILQEVILSLCHPSQKERGTARAAREKLDLLLQNS